MHFSLKLIGEGKSYKEVQKIIGCSAKMISNALKWRAKPETRGRKRKTTIKMDRRITRMAKAQPMISSRMIKDSLELPVSTVTVRRRLCEANLFTRIPRKVPLLKKRHVQKRTLLKNLNKLIPSAILSVPNPNITEESYLNFRPSHLDHLADCTAGSLRASLDSIAPFEVNWKSYTWPGRIALKYTGRPFAGQEKITIQR
uniref:Transposase Tc1-like domain-containing protein n=1 Tax=Mola mola TaxID=94237 RepID=A0A3Q4BQW7_MOLML